MGKKRDKRKKRGNFAPFRKDRFLRRLGRLADLLFIHGAFECVAFISVSTLAASCATCHVLFIALFPFVSFDLDESIARASKYTRV